MHTCIRRSAMPAIVHLSVTLVQLTTYLGYKKPYKDPEL